MLDFNAPEFLVVAIVALLVIGPRDLPKAMRFVGKWFGKARSVARQFRSGFDSMVREAELAEMEKQWAAENERIMREHPAAALPATENTATEDGDPVMVEQPVLAEAPKPKRTRKPGIKEVAAEAEAAAAPKRTRKPRTPPAEAAE